LLKFAYKLYFFQVIGDIFEGLLYEKEKKYIQKTIAELL